MVQLGVIVTSFMLKMSNLKYELLVYVISLLFPFQGDTKYDDQDESPCATEVDQITKVQLLENELAQAMEVNNKYKMQLHRCV